MANTNHTDRAAMLGGCIESCQDALYRYAFFRTGSADDAKDIVQQLFLRLYDSGRDLSDVGNARAYLFRSLSNMCSDLSRKARPPATPLTEPEPACAAESDEEELMREYERISRIMEGIPQQQAEAIRMKTLAGMSFVEIGDALGLPVTTVKSRFKYGVEKIRSKIRLNDGGE